MLNTRKTIKFLIFLPAILVLLYFLITFLNHLNHRFSKRKWDQYENKRYELCEDLINKKLLINKSEQDVIDLLGEPSLKVDSMQYWRYETGTKQVWINDERYSLSLLWKNGKVILAKADTITVKF